MAKKKGRKLNKNIQIAYNRLLDRGELLCRQYSSSEEAVKYGGNYIYFTVKDNKPFPTGSGRFLIENSLALPSGDGLFDDTPQTFKAVNRDDFNAFRENFEEAVNV